MHDSAPALLGFSSIHIVLRGHSGARFGKFIEVPLGVKIATVCAINHLAPDSQVGQFVVSKR